jgi:aminocarboxymuconate-semialdehyde decarboxylase
VEAVGADRVLLGSDYPADMSCERPVDFVLNAGLDEATTRAILSGNAARAFDR